VLSCNKVSFLEGCKKKPVIFCLQMLAPEVEILIKEKKFPEQKMGKNSMLFRLLKSDDGNLCMASHEAV
jgi:hypothetical protein